MIFSLECEVKSTVTLKNELTIICDEKTIIFKPNNNILSSIQIKKKVKEGQKCSNYEIKTAIKRHHNVIIDVDKDLVEDIKSDFRNLESILCLDYGIEKIFWETPKLVFEPENEQEKENLLFKDLKPSKKYIVNATPLNPEHVKYLFNNKDKLNRYMIPLAFLREGLNEYRDFRYIYAYYNFYFIIEDLFADGEWKADKFIQKCKESKDFIKYSTIIYKSDEKFKLKIKKWLDIYNYPETPEGFCKLIFKVRGSLHHFANKNSQKQGTPFNHADYEVMAYFLMSIVMLTLADKIEIELPNLKTMRITQEFK